jgi:hypothetical protein
MQPLSYAGGGEMHEHRAPTADEVILGLEYILGQRSMQALVERLEYEYFGTRDIASIVKERPELFERAMKEILGSAGPALLNCIRKSLR